MDLGIIKFDDKLIGVAIIFLSLIIFVYYSGIWGMICWVIFLILFLSLFGYMFFDTSANNVKVIVEDALHKKKEE